MLARPPHTPIFSWQEGVFFSIRDYLEERIDEITEENFDTFIAQAADAVAVEKIRGYAVEAHYYVPGREWQPWRGD